MDVVCPDCGALHWRDGRVGGSSANPQFGMCCNHGKIVIPKLAEPPVALKSLTPSNSTDFSFKFSRHQFPARLAFALTINKAQGQSVKFVGLDLRVPVFSHYVVFSRATSGQCIRVLLPDNSVALGTINVVYPEQWTNAFNDYARVQATENSAAAPKAPLKSVFPVIGFFPETTRYKKKPVPWVKRYVSFGGYLSGIVSSLEGETMQERFRVEVDNIAFLGTYTPLASTPSPTLTASTSGASGSSAGSKACFSYSKFSQKHRHDDDSSNGPTSFPFPATATTPSG
ncbi:hypothetical protein B0H13DRAFT_2331721 [Mycena leptocephala]|nr:hypothetical protein B0H13DRAFT_2331721 [Mycena leptocephala]